MASIVFWPSSAKGRWALYRSPSNLMLKAEHCHRSPSKPCGASYQAIQLLPSVFSVEVRVATQLRNPHTVMVHDSGQGEDGQLYFVMEYIIGPTLRQVLRQHGPLPVERVIRIASQLCKAFMEAHSLPDPVVHRDLKPPNIFVEQQHGQDWVKIVDFGIAKSLVNTPLD